MQTEREKSLNFHFQPLPIAIPQNEGGFFAETCFQHI